MATNSIGISSHASDPQTSTQTPIDTVKMPKRRATSSRPARRNLVRWSDQMNNQLLLCIQSAANTVGQRLPWEEIAEMVGATINAPTITGGAIVQHLAKMRSTFVEFGISVPPPLRRGGASGRVRAAASSRATSSRVNKTKRSKAHEPSDNEDESGDSDSKEDLVDVDKASDSEEEYGKKPVKRIKPNPKPAKRAAPKPGSRKVQMPVKKRESTSSGNDVKLEEGPSAVALGKRRRTSVSPIRGRRITRGSGSRLYYAKLAGDELSSDEDTSNKRSPDSERVAVGADYLRFTQSDDDEKVNKKAVRMPKTTTKKGKRSRIMTITFTKDNRKAFKKIVGNETSSKENSVVEAAMAEHEVVEANDDVFNDYAAGELALSENFINNRFGGPADDFGYSAPEPVENEYTGVQKFDGGIGTTNFDFNATSGAGPSTFQGLDLSGLAGNPGLSSIQNMLSGNTLLNSDPTTQSFNPYRNSGNNITSENQDSTVNHNGQASQSHTAGTSTDLGLPTGTSLNQITPGFATGDFANDLPSSYDGFGNDLSGVGMDDSIFDIMNFDPYGHDPWET